MIDKALLMSQVLETNLGYGRIRRPAKFIHYFYKMTPRKAGRPHLVLRMSMGVIDSHPSAHLQKQGYILKVCSENDTVHYFLLLRKLSRQIS